VPRFPLPVLCAANAAVGAGASHAELYEQLCARGLGHHVSSREALDALYVDAHSYVERRRAALDESLSRLESAWAQPWTKVRGGSDLAVLQAVAALARRH